MLVIFTISDPPMTFNLLLFSASSYFQMDNGEMLHK